MTNKRLVLFDLDNTLLSGDSDFEWGLFLASKGVHDRSTYEAKNLAFYEDYRSGRLDIDVFLDFQLSPLARYSRQQLNLWHREFLETRITPLITDKAKAIIATEKEKASLMAIVTATNSFVTRPIANLLTIEHLVATEPEVLDNGEYSGKILGIPCFQAGKITKVTQWLHSLNQSWDEYNDTVFYSDSLNDLPLLEKVSCPIAVDPDETLLAHAQYRGWQIISLR
ncbi:MAG: phosphoserine phosphatase [Ferrovum sp. 37-45-19]|uniref:histidinol-phosphatase n=1 Tax=Ferrovum sp. JA12 TaxID=1356299 RepID=UPI000702E6C0|nr:HAD family hydrolase [Ferrovum sp. JA12]OYV79857.1 MAG: phosphoserine phosphatase [Ferrovum sp. 21-44-67]OYV95481.1 MAG: phosphoserine phosphatase [Ferrovum sp. 37-45-19]OZB31526.1 MAG: phosphoserine phosphatase [Ferrovum sp. 34-44-207]HQT81277.1 HAD family hydrolase [Ferrovaceae bacterium]KRH78164.1 haloacid dehalogenase-like hydrolase [Ferrovum sp. JA12]